MLNNYKSLSLLGKGSFSKVYKAINTENNEMCAIKVINIEYLDRYKNRIVAELNIIKKLNHENVLKFKEIIKCKNNICMICELCDTTLSKIMDNSMTEKEIHNIFFQIMDGIKYLYDNKIFHRDIKPDNILMKNDKIKIADFGFAKEIDKTDVLSNTLCGTPVYMAPEIILGEAYNTKSDIWSLGVILYQLMYKKHPYGEIKNYLSLIKIYNEKRKIIFNTNYSELLIDLVSKMLIQNPINRISWQDLFSHEWLYKAIVEINIENSIDFDAEFDTITNNMDMTISNSNLTDDIFNSATVSNNLETFVSIKSQPINISNMNNENNIKIANSDVQIIEDHFSPKIMHMSDKLLMESDNKINSKKKENFNFMNLLKDPFKYFSL